MIYDFAPEPSEFPDIRGNFFFYQCTVLNKQTYLERCLVISGFAGSLESYLVTSG